MKTTIFAALFTIFATVSGYSQKHLGVFDAVKLNDSTTLAMCLNSGLKPNTANTTGNTLLMEASKNGSYAAAKLLLAHGAKVNAQNEMGNTALMEATLRGDAQMVTILMHAGANASIINTVGETAFTIAEGFDKADIAQLFTDKNEGSKEGYAKLR
ncbi:hypothetical protein SAMN05421788_110207 [Filimonas lacunae]|uniref:Uncharacterized protein n=1 Tax=Filimonas lacunae TaxID=477680 RepID=A0A173MAB6_9BACT|nr:ankyrin repeat domain-containing protein [Filimonas lacunae]BAV04472.1 ankyrin-repeat containing protein [Filimonas lacunae]SIT31517.1 hypothetical protein SAMN05421788_110207 [Filimonas lacunae]